MVRIRAFAKVLMTATPKAVALIGALSLAACDGDMDVQSNAAAIEAAGGATAQLTNENCVDPNLKQISAKIKLTLCDGTLASGQLPMTECTADGEVGCVATEAFKAASAEAAVATNIATGVTIAGVSGEASVEAHAECAGDGATGCVTTTAFKAAATAGGLTNKIKNGTTLAGVAGSYDGNYVACAVDGEAGCIVQGPAFKAANASQATPGNIKAGVTVAGVAGTYPSALTPLAAATATTDLPGLAATVPAGAYEFFDETGARYTGAVTDAGTITAGAADQTFDASVYRGFTVAGAPSLAAGNIKSGITLFGTTGTVVPSPADCTANAQINCVATATFKAADLSQAVGGNIRNGMSIAGIVGTYPSATTPLAGDTATNDLISLAATVSAGTYEFFDAAGNVYTGAITNAGTISPGVTDQTFSASLYRQFTVNGDANLTAGNIKAGATIFGTTGTVPMAPADCSTNAEVGCVATTAFKAADLSLALAQNIRSGVSLAGVLGTYPSVATPLNGATGTTDLTSLSAATAAGSYEFFDSAGVRRTGTIADAGLVVAASDDQTFSTALYRQFIVSGDANLDASNIKAGVVIFGELGTLTSGPLNCSANAEVGCVSTTVFKAADLSNLDAGNIKTGVIIAGVTGGYPSVTHPLAGANGTTDLPAFTDTAGGGMYEWFRSDGSRLSGVIEADVNAAPGAAAQTFSTGLYRSVAVSGDAELVVGNIRTGVDLFGVSGNVTPAASNCASDGEVGCVTTASYIAADMSNVIPSNIKIAIVVAGVTGTLNGSPANCASNGEQGCVSTATYKAANLTNLVAGNIKNGVTVAGTAGTYPSLATPLAGASGTSDLISLAAATPAGSYEFFDSTGTRYTGTVTDAATITPGTSNQTFNASLYRQFTVAGDADLAAGNIATGANIFSVVGTVTPEPGNCSSDAQTGCVATVTYKAANTGAFVASDVKTGKTIGGVAGSLANCSTDGGVGCVAVATYKAVNMTNATAGNIKTGVTLAAVAGDYPSATYRLPGADATADLDSGTFANQAKSATAFEFWNSGGSRHTSAGDADITAGNIVTGANVFGTAGSVIVESHGNCGSDGATGCITTASYKAANMSNATAGNIKSGVTIAGAAGNFPSATYPLTGASGTADLDSATFNAKVKSATAFEYWNSAGVQQAGAGDADLVANKIKSTVAMFGLTGTYHGPLTAPTGFTATPSGTTVNLAWNAGYSGYIVVRRTGSAVTWTPTDGTSYSTGAIDANHTIVYASTGTSYANTGLTAATNYYYALYGFNASTDYSYAAAAIGKIGYLYYRLYVTSISGGDQVIIGNIDVRFNGTWVAENVNGNTGGTIGGIGVTLSASTGNQYAWEGIDDAVSSVSDTWESDDNTYSTSSPYNGSDWLKMVFASPVTIDGLKIFGVHNSSSSGDYAPDRWRLERSLNNSTWETVPGSEVLTNTDTYKVTYTQTW